jgi:hypothetical protein
VLLLMVGVAILGAASTAILDEAVDDGELP